MVGLYDLADQLLNMPDNPKTTGADGWFGFDGLAPGSYWVKETGIPSGGIATTPTNQAVNVLSCQTTAVTFGVKMPAVLPPDPSTVAPALDPGARARTRCERGLREVARASTDQPDGLTRQSLEAKMDLGLFAVPCQFKYEAGTVTGPDEGSSSDCEKKVALAKVDFSVVPSLVKKAPGLLGAPEGKVEVVQLSPGVFCKSHGWIVSAKPGGMVQFKLNGKVDNVTKY